MPFARFLRGRTSLATDVLHSVGGAVLSKAITAASLPVLTHMYAPIDFGVWPLLLAFTGFLMPLATLRYDIAVVLAKSRRVAVSLVWVILIATTLVSVSCLFALVLVGSQTASAVVGLDALYGAYAFIIPVVAALSASQAALQAWLTRNKHFQAIATSQIAQAAVTAAASILLGWLFEPSAAMIVAGSLTGLGVAIAANTWGARRTSLELPNGRRFIVTAWNAMRRYKVYPLYIVPYSLSSGLTDRLFQILLASMFSVSVLGVYFVARQLVYAPFTILPMALRQVVFAHSVGTIDAGSRKALVARVLGDLAFLEMPIVAFSLFWVPFILEWLTGSLWARIGEFAFWLIVPASTVMLTNWLDRIFDVLGRQRLSLALQISSDLTILGVILFSLWRGSTDVEAVATVSCAVAIYETLWLGVVLHLLGFNVKEVVLLFGKTVVLLVFSCVVYWTIKASIPPLWAFALSLCFLALSMAMPIRHALRPGTPVLVGSS